ncbi:DUF7685 domain-containing protein [Paraburkholderia atlantica]|uniref:DUF7685 domain-containing protein n=1 Tax=Paraburkholderia atlantica TaxID=2654982 RepID=UPI000A037D7A
MHERCEQCGNSTPPWDIIHCGFGDGTCELLCTSCFNARIAEAELERGPIRFLAFACSDLSKKLLDFVDVVSADGWEYALVYV